MHDLPPVALAPLDLIERGTLETRPSLLPRPAVAEMDGESITAMAALVAPEEVIEASSVREKRFEVSVLVSPRRTTLKLAASVLEAIEFVEQVLSRPDRKVRSMRRYRHSASVDVVQDATGWRASWRAGRSLGWRTA
jgi:hypothetical protein